MDRHRESLCAGPRAVPAVTTGDCCTQAITSQIKSSEVAIEHAYDSPIHQVLATNGLHVLSEKRSLKRVLITALLLVLVFALVFVAQWPLQRYQTSYLAGLPARIHAEQPLYQDALTAPDGDWNI